MHKTPQQLRARRRTQQERREETRKALLEGMMSALIELGYARTTTNEITRRAGLTSGALQHHFASREELVLALADYQFEEVRTQLEAFANDADAKADWQTFIELLREIYSGPRYMAIWEIVMGTRADAHLHALVMQHRIQSQAILERLWSNVFGQRIPDPSKRADLMHFTLATLRGYVFYNVIAPDKRFLERQKEMLSSFLEAEMHPSEGRASVTPGAIPPHP
ncbi:TetR family transcriptional regulator [Pseudaminobacter salicylatoxidans]|uniref:TetR family transcriptional regulator n=2 Tax=Pseudaminobacter salicylatoxidans TaxID=93369 RepID=A0A316C2I6_PSESE|nr:TetR family transcriptional regulator [Pseudaminobacter salicylatoxidans]